MAGACPYKVLCDVILRGEGCEGVLGVGHWRTDNDVDVFVSWVGQELEDCGEVDGEQSLEVSDVYCAFFFAFSDVVYALDPYFGGDCHEDAGF